MVIARLQGDVHGRPPRARAAAAQGHDFCVLAPDLQWQPSPITAPSFTITDPTRGFGDHGQASHPSGHGRCIQIASVLGASPTRALRLSAQQRAHLVHELLDVAKRTVDRRKPYISDLVKASPEISP